MIYEPSSWNNQFESDRAERPTSALLQAKLLPYLSNSRQSTLSCEGGARTVSCTQLAVREHEELERFHDF